MSTNKSQNLKLHLWEPEDDFLRTEFNENFEKIDTGIKSTEQAIETVRTEAEKLPYVMGSYVGNEEDREFNLGFKPAFVLFYRHQYYTSGDGAGNSMAIASPLIHSNRIYITDQGFRFDMSGRAVYPQINSKDLQYEYIAFR